MSREADKHQIRATRPLRPGPETAWFVQDGHLQKELLDGGKTSTWPKGHLQSKAKRRPRYGLGGKWARYDLGEEMQVKISQIKVNGRVRKDMGDIQSLAESISELGQLQPIGIDSNYNLLFGERRIMALSHLGEDSIKAEIHSSLNTATKALQAELQENTEHKPFLPTEAIAAAEKLRELEAAEAKERQGTRTDLEHCGNFPQSDSGKTRDKVGSAVGMSGRTYEKARQVVEAAEQSPEEYGDLPELMDEKSVDAAYKQYKSSESRKERIAKINAISVGNEEIGKEKLFSVIYADPPWRYDYSKADSRKIENQYPTMDLDDICNLEIPAAENAILFLWVTSPKLEEGLRVLNSWGFSYRTCAVWDKEKIGMGYYFRQRHELLLIGVKGDIPVPETENRPDSVICAKRGKHSEKPEIFSEIIEAMYPELSKIELFCRNPRSGWSVWGNQANA